MPRRSLPSVLGCSNPEEFPSSLEEILPSSKSDHDDRHIWQHRLADLNVSVATQTRALEFDTRIFPSGLRGAHGPSADIVARWERGPWWVYILRNHDQIRCQLFVRTAVNHRYQWSVNFTSIGLSQVSSSRHYLSRKASSIASPISLPPRSSYFKPSLCQFVILMGRRLPLQHVTKRVDSDLPCHIHSVPGRGLGKWLLSGHRRNLFTVSSPTSE